MKFCNVPGNISLNISTGKYKFLNLIHNFGMSKKKIKSVEVIFTVFPGP